MAITRIDKLDDPRLTVYRETRNKSLCLNSGRFLVEGWRVVERLLNSDYEVDSVLISERRIETFGPQFEHRSDVFALPQSEAAQLVGFNFHSGVMACAFRPENAVLEDFHNEKSLIVCCPQITGPDNLGSIIRLAAGFGASGILLGSKSADPFLRRVVRVSMGSIFTMPIRTSENLTEDLQSLRNSGYQILAAEKTELSMPLTDYHLPENESPMVLMLGNEAEGLDEENLQYADEVLHIEMTSGVDSLNVANAAAVFLFALTNRSHRPK
ncbi:TrmH family RNA methyltransferase [Rubinisphaera italica]|uniref:Putative TrmH family tRNA/rRNA methyltransferase n=1 Tax=Rubinisphaera italica TaxID=2527969 RepID=A0A5C5XM84_9PLAN|nr:RNA methyltransferase [Rubinisphaera italica]TWT64070.1 putative TrmH family tRNA/rRNA methyltransferase [Rubinisphaera italica]